MCGITNLKRVLEVIPNIHRSKIKSLLTATSFKKGNVQHLAVSGIATANLLALDKLGREMFWSSSCHTFEGHYGVAKI